MGLRDVQEMSAVWGPVNDGERVVPDWAGVEQALRAANLDIETVVTTTYCRFSSANIEAAVDSPALTMLTPHGLLSTAGKRSLLGGKLKYNLLDYNRVRNFGEVEHHDPRGFGKYGIEFQGPGGILLGRLQWHYRAKRFRDNRDALMAVASERDRVLAQISTWLAG